MKTNASCLLYSALTEHSCHIFFKYDTMPALFFEPINHTLDRSAVHKMLKQQSHDAITKRCMK